MNNDIKEVLYSKEQIAEVTKRLGKQITKDFEGKNPLVVCVLKGAVMFTTDIIREIDTYLELDFMDVSSYGEGTESSGEVKIIKDLDTSVTGRDVLIVEDIIDTGRT
ncbi:MAG TPA: hypoxanthine phosphoribosyltransferase, partial [Ligilactobacillus salivarius]|nr:hypoxanthine phosphoribosyltransferase [Ligilactobacillus salivarius]